MLAPGVGVVYPGLSQPDVAGNVGGDARRSVRCRDTSAPNRVRRMTGLPEDPNYHFMTDGAG